MICVNTSRLFLKDYILKNATSTWANKIKIFPTLSELYETNIKCLKSYLVTSESLLRLLLQFDKTCMCETWIYVLSIIKSKYSIRLTEEDEDRYDYCPNNHINSRSCETTTRSIFAVKMTW
ncbi:hypothetical protein RF11_16424 [Thelohanellus kitauei]|uniref:Uncharacterized protein n=1 Tax=Thelohanellus kitauei TaxID=669202 RepID=A0A0C2MS70_THEKT|nr:hypothetical protein RF11_16424 [Thelohanellus kitauei]